MTEQERLKLRIGYIQQYEELTGKQLVCIERKDRLGHYGGVARKYLLSIAAEYSSIPLEKILSVTKNKEVVNVRKMVSYLLRKMKLTLVEIGRMFDQDHTTIMSNINLVKGYLQVDKDYKADYEEFEKYCIENLENFRQKRQKIDEHQRKAIRDSYESGEITQIELAEIYNVNPTTIGRICKPRK